MAFSEHKRPLESSNGSGEEQGQPHRKRPAPFAPLPNETQITDTRNLQLCFSSKLSLPVYTTTPLKSQLDHPILVDFIDANTDSVVASGPESCAELDVVVLRGDFNKEDNNTWSVKEFEECMVNEHNGKQSLLTCKLQVNLKDSIGELEDLTFTDNSSWTSSKKFRIEVRVASGFCEGIPIHEAITEAFSVKEHRGEAFKRHYPPKSDDDMWRLEEIAKAGSYCKRLNEAGICEVEDFRRILVGDPEKLQKAGCLKKGRSFEAHAKTCVPDGKSYIYHDDMKDFGVMLSNICQFEGFITGGVYHPAELLPHHQKALVDDLVKAARMNWKRVKVFNPDIYSSSMLGKSFPTCSVEFTKEQHLCGNPSDCHLTPLSFPKTQSSEVPRGSLVPMLVELQ